LATRAHDNARQLQDRIDLAREIHDGVIQRLFGVSMALSVDGDLPEAERHRCAAEIQDALADLRSAVQRPLGRTSRATGTTLLAEVRRLADEHPELNVELDATSGDADVPAALEPLAQSVLGEALRNAQKHATPSRVGVKVSRDNGTFVLEVTNDGVEASARDARPTGIGLRLAAFEALQHGGTIEFGQADADCWRVRLLAPVAGARR
jgi:signal transduction histidine kinase